MRCVGLLISSETGDFEVDLWGFYRGLTCVTSKDVSDPQLSSVRQASRIFQKIHRGHILKHRNPIKL